MCLDPSKQPGFSATSRPHQDQVVDSNLDRWFTSRRSFVALAVLVEDHVEVCCLLMSLVLAEIASTLPITPPVEDSIFAGADVVSIELVVLVC